MFSCMKTYPIPPMYGIFTYICHKFMGNVGKYAIHGWYRYILEWLIFYGKFGRRIHGFYGLVLKQEH